MNLNEEPDKLEQKIEKAMPYLFLVSINGADEGNTHKIGWDRLIQPLGEGNYDVLNVLRILKDLGYKNPITCEAGKNAIPGNLKI